MMRAAGAVILLMLGSGAAAADTDFGIRELGKQVHDSEPAPAGEWASSSGRSVNMAEVSRIGARWGQVTSTFRTAAHNRDVGGVANSYHLKGRAIDIARRPGVSHGQIAAAYRGAGYALIESLDEGDHSHFAFGSAGYSGPKPQMVIAKAGEKTEWRIVYAPPSSSGGN
jgi:hypothetical protein